MATSTQITNRSASEREIIECQSGNILIYPATLKGDRDSLDPASFTICGGIRDQSDREVIIVDRRNFRCRKLHGIYTHIIKLTGQSTTTEQAKRCGHSKTTPFI